MTTDQPLATAMHEPATPAPASDEERSRALAQLRTAVAVLIAVPGLLIVLGAIGLALVSPRLEGPLTTGGTVAGALLTGAALLVHRR
ncbi:hypothetical protein ABZ070_16865 [Streptomyces sp. NPDC006283]|uniref:hypothetical protein n=1 Tax=Streptomyces sp. NPDC006283 TaxID=3156741 RepID=UPI0033A75E97